MINKNYIKYLLERESFYYNELMKKLSESSDGNLQISTNKGYPQYYHLNCVSGKKSRTYINKKNFNLAKDLAQKSYLLSVKPIFEKRIKCLEALLADYYEDEIDEVYESLHPYRKRLFQPIMPTRKSIINKWKDTTYQSNLKFNTNHKIYSNKGERVRSKSEKILADKFLELGIDYKYECPLKLKDGSIVHPDFTFINPHTLEEIYWEHHGLMDNPEYLEKTLLKIERYEKNGIFRNQRLIVTYESSTHNLDDQWVRILIDKFLL